MKTRILCGCILGGLLAMNASAYGPDGHKLVGNIADKLLDGKPAAAKIDTLLDGMTLGEAALLPDEIKGWDKINPEEPDAFHLDKHPEIEAQLIAYWEANSEPGASGQPLHREFHYTDVPVKDVEKYDAGDTGRSGIDLVQTIKYCIKVLEGKTSDKNSRKITKPVAVILLAHFVGDIHQPLHVGAEYFNAKGVPVNPDTGQQGNPDRGGNSLSIEINGVNSGTGRYAKNLHGFWDGDAVVEALKQVKHEINPGGGRTKSEAVVQYFVSHEPTWKLDPSVKIEDWSEAWANEIQPVAREAHQRLEFIGMHPSTSKGETVEKGTAKEKDMPDHVAYLEWAGKTVKDEIDKAGWRLAATLEQSLK